MADGDEFLVKPDPGDERLTRRVQGIDQDGRAVTASVTMERPPTLFLNGGKVVTMMTIGDDPESLALAGTGRILFDGDDGAAAQDGQGTGER